MNIKNIRVYGLEESIIASGYPMIVETPNKDEFNEHAYALRCIDTKKVQGLHSNYNTSRDYKRAKTLANTPKGSGHDQALTGIHVDFDLTCTNKMWVEMERYRFVYFVSSQSTMHRMSEFDFKDGYNEYVDPRMIEIMEELKEKYNKTQDTKDYYRLLYSNPAGFELTARLTTNYRSLKTIYSQRRQHLLKEWQEFCNWIETLPMAKELITGRD